MPDAEQLREAEERSARAERRSAFKETLDKRGRPPKRSSAEAERAAGSDDGRSQPAKRAARKHAAPEDGYTVLDRDEEDAGGRGEGGKKRARYDRDRERDRGASAAAGAADAKYDPTAVFSEMFQQVLSGKYPMGVSGAGGTGAATATGASTKGYGSGSAGASTRGYGGGGGAPTTGAANASGTGAATGGYGRSSMAASKVSYSASAPAAASVRLGHSAAADAGAKRGPGKAQEPAAAHSGAVPAAVQKAEVADSGALEEGEGSEDGEVMSE